MSVAPSPAPAQLSPPPQQPMRRFSVDEYHRMIEAGILTEADRVELLEGWIVAKMVHNPRHDATVDRTQDALRRRLSSAWRVRVRSAITTPESEPEPDIAVAIGPASRYEARHPEPGEIALLVEVAESSLPSDRGIKARLYARAGIRQYWIVNVVDQVVEVHLLPTGAPTAAAAYGDIRPYALGATLTLEVPDLLPIAIPVREFFLD
ncbi:MAG TPA: Uma2 family endonuclease [Tepidisphaeraceae bacterium]|nr:Uma2 family endonuclease [Tepidisphaeraceae bacterium]